MQLRSRVPSLPLVRAGANSAQGNAQNKAMEDGDGGDGKASKIRVAVRVRPLSDRELNAGGQSLVRVMDSKMLVFDPADDCVSATARMGIATPCKRPPGSRGNKDEYFSFDHVFGEESSQRDVYGSVVHPLVVSVMQGFNSTIFAYGQTGAGKTHTMMGVPSDPGVVVQAVATLFGEMRKHQEDMEFSVTLSYLEVYNENIRDLLVHGVNPPMSLDVREEAVTGIVVAGLSQPRVTCEAQVLGLIEQGNTTRTQGATDANESSSRSHAVLQLTVQQKDKTDGVSAQWKVGKLTLVDLAGSERAGSVNRNSKSTLKEGCNINKSLLALGNCINALSQGAAAKHVPYRDSKLTRLLKDSLGGNCRTLMIACVSPSSSHYEDTLNTLNYATRTSNIKTSLKRNVLSVEFHVSKYASIIQSLRDEVKEWKDKYHDMQQLTQRSVAMPTSSSPDIAPSGELEAYQSLKDEIVEAYDLKRRDGEDAGVVRRCLEISKRLRSGEVSNPVLLECLVNLRSAKVAEIESLLLKQEMQELKQRSQSSGEGQELDAGDLSDGDEAFAPPPPQTPKQTPRAKQRAFAPSAVEMATPMRVSRRSARIQQLQSTPKLRSQRESMPAQAPSTPRQSLSTPRQPPSTPRQPATSRLPSTPCLRSTPARQLRSLGQVELGVRTRSGDSKRKGFAIENTPNHQAAMSPHGAKRRRLVDSVGMCNIPEITPIKHVTRVTRSKPPPPRVSLIDKKHKAARAALLAKRGESVGRSSSIPVSTRRSAHA